MKDFIIVLSERLRKTTIKRYKPIGATKVNVYYNTSRYKIDVDIFDCKTKKGQKDLLEHLDNTL
jgi:hypothetical protein